MIDIVKNETVVEDSLPFIVSADLLREILRRGLSTSLVLSNIIPSPAELTLSLVTRIQNNIMRLEVAYSQVALAVYQYEIY